METIGYATLPIIPSMRGVSAELNRQLGGILPAAGAKAGDQLGSSFSAAVSKATQTAAQAVATSFTATAATAVVALDKGWNRLTTIQDASSALDVSLGSNAASAQFLGQVLDTVKGTPFNLDQFAAAGQQMVGFGVEAAKVPRYLTAIGEASATQGKRADEFAGRLSEVFGQVAASGQVSLADVWRISDTGVNALAILANSFGVTTDAMKDMISKGAVPADQALDALASGILDGSNGPAGATVALAGTMEGLRKNMSGAVSGIDAAMARFGASIIEPFSPAVIAGANGLSDTFDRLGERAGNLAEKVAGSDGFDKLVGFLGDLPDLADRALDGLDKIAPVAAAAGAALTAMGADSLPVIGSFLPEINPVVAAVAALAFSTPEARDAMSDLAREVAPLVGELAHDLVPVLVDLTDIAGDTVPAAIDLFALALHGALDLAIPLAGGVERLTSLLSDHEEVIFAVAGAYAGLKTASLYTAAVESQMWGTIASGAVGAYAGILKFNAAIVADSSLQSLQRLKNAITGIGTASVSAGVATAGIFAGIAVGAGLAEQSLRNSQSKAEKFAQGVTDKLDLNPRSIQDGLRGMQEYDRQISKLLGKATETGAFGHKLHQVGQDIGSAFGIGSKGVEEAGRTIAETADRQDKLATSTHNLIENYSEVARQTGLSVNQVQDLADVYGIDLASSFGKSEDGRKSLIGDIVQMNINAQAAGIAIDDALQMDPEKLKADADAVKSIMSGVASSIAGYLDVLTLKDEPVDPKQLKSAQKQVEEAEQKLADLQGRRGQKEIESAQKRLTAAQAATREAGLTADELADARASVADAKADLADVKENASRDVQDAADNLASARDALTELQASDSPLDADKIAEFYRSQLDGARTFNSEIQTAIQMGLTPELVARMLTQGPEQAGPILEQIVGDTSGGMVKLVNAAETEIAKLSASTIRTAQLTQIAVNSGSQRYAEELSSAIVLAQQVMVDGGKSTLDQLASNMHLKPEQVQQIAKDFQIDLSAFGRDATVALQIDSTQPVETLDDVKRRFQEYIASNPLATAYLDNAPVLEATSVSSKLFDQFVAANPETVGKIDISNVENNAVLLAQWATEWAGSTPEATFKAIADTGTARAQLDDLAQDRTVLITAKWAEVGADGKTPLSQYYGGGERRVIEGTRASGGQIWPGAWLFGENGREIVEIGPNGMGMVHNAAATQTLLGGFEKEAAKRPAFMPAHAASPAPAPATSRSRRSNGGSTTHHWHGVADGAERRSMMRDYEKSLRG